MTRKQRTYYMAELWPAAARAQGWDRKDDARRHAATLHATGQSSSTALDEHQITALFSYLGHLAGFPAAARTWARIQRTSARAVNLVRQGEHFRDMAGYRAGGRVDMDRFHKLGDGDLEPDMTEAEAEQYAMTMSARARTHHQHIVEDTRAEPDPF